MKATMNLDDQLYRRVKVRAAQDGVTVTSLVELALRGLLDGKPQTATSAPYELPVLTELGPLAPGVDLYDNSALLDLMDGPDTFREETHQGARQ